MPTRHHATQANHARLVRACAGVLALMAATACAPAWADAQLVAGAGKASAHLRFKIVVPPVVFVSVGSASNSAKPAHCQAQVAPVCVSGNLGIAQLVRSEAPAQVETGFTQQQAAARVLYTAAMP